MSIIGSFFNLQTRQFYLFVNYAMIPLVNLNQQSNCYLYREKRK
ncbi:hypothetical protein CDIMF43_40003 [Carnobacterium divergens]|nr:hypothetical protein CDIMF43_40003 [Carnobacterium divergens]